MRKIPNINTHIFKQPDLPWSLISDEAQAMLDNYELLGIALTGIERSFMIAYIDAEVANGNYALRDYETIYSLSGVNALVDYIGGKVAIAVNAPTHDVNGYTFDGATNFIDTEWDASLDAILYTQNDALVGAFIKAVTSSSGNCAFGRRISSSSNMRLLAQLGNTYGAVVNGAGVVTGTLVNEGLTTLARTSATQLDSYQDGIVDGTNAAATIGTVPSSDVTVGAQSGTANFFTGTISNFMTGGAVGFSQTGYNTNLRALLTGLGAI